jgi:hypothetical protein
MVVDGDSSRQENGGVERLIEAGSNLAGAISGAVVGARLASDPSAVIAAAAGGSAVFTYTLNEIGQRLLGHREAMRVGGAAIYASELYRERISKGGNLRDDNWFDERPHGRSIAAEICEGTLLIAQREHEERKVQFYGYLLANLSFEIEIDEYLANWLLRTAETLTWSQLVLLAMIGRKDRFDVPAVRIGESGPDWTPWGLHQQLADLGYGKLEFIGIPQPEAGPKNPGTFTIPRINLDLRDQQLVGAGALLYPLMWLERIPDEDIELFITLLQPDDEDDG